jgi:hypothetical protein
VTMKRLTVLGFVLASSVALWARAEALCTIDATRIHLRDVSEGYDEGELASLDLGPAAPPGNSRLVSRSDVLEQLRAAGDDTKSLRMPSMLRVKSAARHWTPDELRDLLTPKLLEALPLGLTLQSSKFTRALVTSPSMTVGSVHFPKFPKREGELTLTVTVDLKQEDVTVLRVPVTVVVLVSEAAIRPTAAKGARVNLIIEHGLSRVSALATALSDTELGGLGLFRICSRSSCCPFWGLADRATFSPSPPKTANIRQASMPRRAPMPSQRLAHCIARRSPATWKTPVHCASVISRW